MVTPVQNQGGYGTCWAFATIGGIEHAWLQRHREVVDLSEQDLINCNCRPCNGGYNNPLWEGGGVKLVKTGVGTQASLPYKGDGQVSPCSDAKVSANCGPCNTTTVRPYRAEAYAVIDADDTDVVPPPLATMKQALLSHGSLVVKMHIPNGSAIGGHKGTGTFKETVPLVYDNPATPGDERNNGAHIVVITGWDDARGAWEIKNSWDVGWGDGGFGWIAYGSNNIGMGAWWVLADAPDFRLTGVWTKSTGDDVQVYGWKYADYRARYDQLWADGYRLHALETAVVQNEVQYSAIWRKGAVPEVQVYGFAYADFKAKYDELWPQGWRLHLLNTYVLSGQVRYTAVWRKSTAGEIQLFGATYADLKKRYDELWPQNWRLEILAVHVENGQARYGAVWRPGQSGELQLFGASYADYRKVYDEQWGKGWRLHLLSNYVINGSVRYDAVWRPGTYGEIQVYSWEYDDFRAKDADLRADGWRLSIVNTHPIG